MCWNRNGSSLVCLGRCHRQNCTGMLSQKGFKGQMGETDYTRGKDILEETASTKVLGGQRIKILCPHCSLRPREKQGLGVKLSLALAQQRCLHLILSVLEKALKEFSQQSKIRGRVS